MGLSLKQPLLHLLLLLIVSGADPGAYELGKRSTAELDPYPCGFDSTFTPADWAPSPKHSSQTPQSLAVI